MRPLTLALAFLLAGALSVASVRSAPAVTSRLVDRTFSCSVDLRAGIRILDVSAVSGFRDPETQRWKWFAAAEVGRRNPVAYVYVTAGGVPSRTRTRPPLRWLSIDALKCKAITAPVALSPRGLVGGPASQFEGAGHAGTDAYECEVPSRVIVRIRAFFDRRTTLLRQFRFGQRVLTTATVAIVEEARFAVRTRFGKRIAYAEVFASGKARLFVAPTCVPD